ncbi:hypothetical protein GCM10007198_16180 [Microbacterium aerolatum]|uniref:Uncharacterized protein n=1 Tax=Microbacterium aerolatum TaxID=153731 RepID=A0A511AJP4_9MICO|nr:hypothetical protein MAE01_13230 [Microbacterium aerolatum]GGB26528.1 hypothetical protein GCM10007198_16180 [Microbacterium aerolatum]
MALGVDELVERLPPFAGLFRIAVEGALGVRILIVDGHVEPFVKLAGLAKETGSDAGESCRLGTTRAVLSLAPFDGYVAHAGAG